MHLTQYLNRGNILGQACLLATIGFSIFVFLSIIADISAEQISYDNDTKLGFYWSPPEGQAHLVEGYRVYVSVDGSEKSPIITSELPHDKEHLYYIEGKAYSVYRVRVEAMDTRGNFGLTSDWSDPVMCTPGDANYDGKVDVLDAIMVLSGASPGADINDDGKVGTDDLSLVWRHWGNIYYSSEGTSLELPGPSVGRTTG